MKRTLLGIVTISLGISIAATALAQSAPAPAVTKSTKNVREERPNVVSGQLLGRGILYTVNYERYFASWLGIGAGVMGFAASGGGFGMVPVYLSLNPFGDEHSLYVSPGVMFAFGTFTGINSTLSQVIGTAEIGWQMQLRSGFMMRAGVDLLYGSGGFIVWPGVAFGGSF
ncbi:MAG: hypothetical protein HYY84_14635 [Deltaproteobacteria bacterium]|nr:hypothetical protein [Deltaproteobacteria bacterium]